MSDCTNCDNRKCMDCVFRVWHDECTDSCPECCPEYGEQLQAAHDAEIRRIKAEAWDEGFDAGEQDVFEHFTNDDWEKPHACIQNPYRDASE